MAKRIADLEKELVKWREVADEQAARLRKIAEESDKQFVNSHVNYSATSNRASCFNHYCVGYDVT